MSFFNNLKIRTKLGIVLILVAMLPALAIAIAYNIEEKELKADYEHNLVKVAKDIGEVIDRNLFERYGDVQAFGYNTAAHDPANWGRPSAKNPLVGAMNNYTKAYGLYPLMILVSPQGDVLATNNVSALGTKLDTKFIYSLNFSEEMWFKDALEGKFLEGKDGLTGTVVGKPHQSELVQKIYGNEGYVLPFSAQVLDTSGDLVGIWVNFAEMKLVEDIVGEYHQAVVEVGIAVPDFMIVDKEGHVLVDYDPDFLKDGVLGHDWSNLLIKNFAKDGLEPAIEAAKGKSGAWYGVSPDSGEESVIAYAPADGAYTFTGLGWSILIAIDPDHAFSLLNKIHNMMLIVMASALLGAIIIALIVGRAAAKPIQASANVIQSIADGNTDIEVTGGSRKDEIGDLARASLVFKEAVIERRKLEAEQKEAAQCAVIEKKKAQEELANRFEQRVQGIINTVASASTELYQTAESMGHVIDDVNSKVTSVSGASQSASHNVNSVAAASEEMSATVKEIAHQIARSVQSVREAMSNVNKADETSEQLEQATKKIGEIVVLIQSIASQINLLALNATIESARAGEAGKGFAVVAGEVKALATQTSKATDQIASYIQSIQSVSSQVVGALQSVKSSMSSVDEYSTAMSAAVEEQSAATNEIASNMGSAASVTDQINSDMIDVKQSAAEANASAGQVLDAAKMLSQEAEALNHEVKNFLNEVRNG
jgi:methyl-accepting chemotaxis protein